MNEATHQIHVLLCFSHPSWARNLALNSQAIIANPLQTKDEGDYPQAIY